MRCTIPEISWHNREPVLSVDIHPVSDNNYKLASSGGDSHILIWQMVLLENGSVKQEVVSDLKRHQKSVNSVRWSYSGQYLASADDDANIIIWQLKTDNIPLLEDDSDDKETWIVFKILRGHKEDIYDLCWSVDNSKLLTGSVDNTAIIWDLTKGRSDIILSDHKGFVQGVAWDPKDQLLATISTDRICRIFDKSGKQVKKRIYKGFVPVPDEHFLHEKECKYFHDDTFKSFFRRLQFTPDGSLLIVPSGHLQADNCKNYLNCTLLFTLDNLTEPVAVLPLDKQSSTVVRCCPLLFHLHEKGPEPVIKLPYRMIFAISTDHDIILYDTQQVKPFAKLSNIHYTRITDLSWSSDGLLLIASSTDGFCSLISFSPEELGREYVKPISEEETSVTIASDNDENIDESYKSSVEVAVQKDSKEKEAKKRPSFLLQWAQNTKQAKKEETDEVVEIQDDDDSNKSNVESTETIKVDKEKLQKTPKKGINVLTPRRIKPTKIGNSEDKNDAIIDTQKETQKPVNILIPRRIKPIKIDGDNKNESKDPKISPSDRIDDDKSKDETLKITPRKGINVLTPKRIKPTQIDEDKDKNKAVIETNSSQKPAVNVLTPRRIKPTRVDDKDTNFTLKLNESKELKNSPTAVNVTPTASPVITKEPLEATPRKDINVLTPKRIKPTTINTNNKATTETNRLSPAAATLTREETKPIEEKEESPAKDETPKTKTRKELKFTPPKDNKIVTKSAKKDKEKDAKKRSSFILQWARNTPKKPKNTNEVIVIDDDEERLMKGQSKTDGI
ncbi:unnamed protein product [Phyllotreta striolata]|uniref:CAF1B/HIR1 beta-propeller domain-containing protein n=1 Tax=Phyllotreta striolata TaxID=444603 RepID=A0A9N9TVE6_PHYSR|nr:unnamed protein product [Phyllotreta striolata]